MDITIVIPVYNRKEYIQKTLTSIPEAYPVILVDNGSTDGSRELCTALAKIRPNTQVAQELTPGAASARNKGLSLCQSTWIYFFDSDDLFTGLPTTWNEDSDLICFPTHQQLEQKIKERSFSPVTTPHTHILNSMLNTQGMIFRTSFLRDIGGWNPQCFIWDDWELGLRALLHAPKVQWITDKTYHVILVHPDSLTGANFASRIDRILQALDIAFNDIYDLAPKDNQAFAALFYRCYILCGKMRHEGHPDAATQMRTFIYDHFRVNRQSHQMGSLFEWGAAKGIRGVWRIALWLVNHSARHHASRRFF